MVQQKSENQMVNNKSNNDIYSQSHLPHVVSSSIHLAIDFIETRDHIFLSIISFSNVSLNRT